MHLFYCSYVWGAKCADCILMILRAMLDQQISVARAHTRVHIPGPLLLCKIATVNRVFTQRHVGACEH